MSRTPRATAADHAEQRRAALYLCLASIPPGQVASYGQLAAQIGMPGAARWVARSLAQLPENSQLPWHRVLCASGRPGLPAESTAGRQQRERLRTEGVILERDRVDLQRHGWRPPPPSG